jgi:hypothetical protein
VTALDRDLADNVQHALGIRVTQRTAPDGTSDYLLERVIWCPAGLAPHWLPVAGWVAASVRPATVDEYRMYDLLCTAQTNWPGVLSGEHDG